MGDWSLEDAKSGFHAVVKAAMEGTPQRVTSGRKELVVVVDAAEFDRLKRVESASAPSLPELPLAIPQDDGEFERIDVAPREIDL